MNRLHRTLIWPLVAVVSLFILVVFVAAMIGSAVEWIFQ